eukprot:335799-Hanusia_phi.AAC.1
MGRAVEGEGGARAEERREGSQQTLQDILGQRDRLGGDKPDHTLGTRRLRRQSEVLEERREAKEKRQVDAEKKGRNRTR